MVIGVRVECTEEGVSFVLPDGDSSVQNKVFVVTEALGECRTIVFDSTNIKSTDFVPVTVGKQGTVKFSGNTSDVLTSHIWHDFADIHTVFD